MEKKKLIGFYDYTVVLTYMGMLFAFGGILLVMQGWFRISVICLMAAGVCDMFDGCVANTKDRNRYEKHFGVEIDSMCDLISFGVLPAIFVYRITGGRLVVGIISALFVLCGLIRLAYYNVQEYERQQQSEGKREVFLGLPITSSAVVIPFAFILFSEVSAIRTIIFPIALVLLGAGYITGFELKKPNGIGKLALIAVGLAEVFGLFFLRGAHLL